MRGGMATIFQPDGRELRPIRVLVVDDDPRFREGLADYLTARGYAIRQSELPNDALALLREERFDLLLTDLRMPAVSGLDLAREVTSSHPDLPVVLLTVVEDVQAARDALRHGAIDFVTKLAGFREIEMAIERNLERKRLERARLEAREAELFLEAIGALATALDAKEPAMAGHSRRVGWWVVRLAEVLGLSAEERFLMQLGALMHDVGKIGVPDQILIKQGPLTEYEWTLIKRHPVEGARIVGQIQGLAAVADLIRHHHERMDGRGYPDGLAGEAIPLGARLVAVADTYDNIISDHPYRARRTSEEALTELKRCVGTQFDPAVVHLFCQLVQHSSPA